MFFSRIYFYKRIVITILCCFSLISIFAIRSHYFFNSNRNVPSEIFNEYPYIPVIQIQSDESPYALEWYRIWGGSYIDYGEGIAIDTNRNIYLVGSTRSFGAGYYDAFLVKYDFRGNQLWNLTWGGDNWDYGVDIATSETNIYITGLLDSFNVDAYDGFLVKYDSSGNQLWNRTWGGPDGDGFHGICINSQKSLFLAGGTWIGNGAVLVVKYDSMGNQIWNQTWDGNDNDYGVDITVDNDDNVILAGYTQSFGTGRDFNAFLVKFDSYGKQLWNRSWGGSANDFGTSIAVDEGNNIYLAGYTYSSGSSYADVFLAKFDSYGKQLWNRTWGTSSYEEICYGIIIDGNNSYITGYIYNSIMGYRAFLAKFDSIGNEIWTIIWDLPQNSKAYHITMDSDKNIYLTGDIETDPSVLAGHDAFFAKYGIDTDGDGLTDYVEINIYGTNPNDSDTYDDGLNDGIEVNVYYTNPKNWDTDGDGYSDGWEIQNGYNPLNYFSNLTVRVTMIVTLTLSIIGISWLTFRKFKKTPKPLKLSV